MISGIGSRHMNDCPVVNFNVLYNMPRLTAIRNLIHVLVIEMCVTEILCSVELRAVNFEIIGDLICFDNRDFYFSILLCY